MGKIALIGNSDLVIYNFRRELVERLRKEGHEVYLLIPELVHKEYFQEIDCKVYETPMDRRGTNPFTDLKLYHLYKKLLKEIRPDIIYTFTIKCNVYGGVVARRLHIPQIANVTGLGSSIKGGGILQKISTSLYHYGIKKAVCTFYQNEENEKICLDYGIVGKKYRRLPGSGVNLEQFQPLPYEESDTVHFMFISRIMKEKGIEEYLETARAIKEKYSNTCFHILGFCEEDYLKNLHNLENEDIIKYHGMQEDMVSFQKMNHCTIHPSYHEGMSNVCLESAASARPVITTNVAGCKETVDDDKTGFIAQVGSSDSLIEAVEKFLSLSWEERKNMGQKARMKMEQEFNRQIVVDAYLEESMPYLKR